MKPRLPRRRAQQVAGLVALVLVFVLGSVVFARTGKVESEPAPTAIDKVVIFAIPTLGIDDVHPGVMPVLSRLADQGAIAATNVRTSGDQPDALEGYASLGAGNRIGLVTPEPLPGHEPVPLTATAVTLSASASGVPGATGDVVVVPEMPTIVSSVEASTGSAVPGALAASLHAAGLRTAVVTNAGTSGPDKARGAAAPAAVAVAGQDGVVDTGDVSGDLLRADPRAPLGVTADPAAYASAVRRAVRHADVVMVDPGETSRVVTLASTLADGESLDDGPRLAALERTDSILGHVVKQLDRRTLLLVVGITPSGPRWALTPMVATGGGIPHGYLHSSSTHRPDLVTLTDIAPTALDALGLTPPDAMIGNPLHYRPGDANWDGALKLDKLLERRAPIDQPMAIAFIVVQTVIYLIAIGLLLLRASSPSWVPRAVELTVLTCGAWPLATFWLRVAPSLYSLGAGTFALSWVVAIGVAFAVSRLRAHVLDPVLALCVLTVATLVGDLATGAHLQYGSFFGYAPTTAPRFTGIGNAAFALLGGATVVICTALVARSRDRTGALLAAGAVAVVVTLADGAPWMGADVGGILTLVPVLCITFWALTGRRIRWYTLGLALLAGALVLGLAVGIEALRAPDQRTHVGRFFLESGDHALVRSTFARKWSTNMRVLRRSPLAWLVPIMAGVGFVALAAGRAWRRVLPQGSPERVGVTATLAMGFAGWLLNDSGVVVLALASVFLGPYILLLATAAPDHPARRRTKPDRGLGYPFQKEAPGNVKNRMPDPQATERPLRPGSVDVVAIVPAKDREDSVGATVLALLALPQVDRVLVVDDGSSDDTAGAARSVGADVLRLPTNRGKGGAVAAGVAETPDADVYLLIDADLASTAAAAALLLDPVLAGDADLTVGVLPSAQGKGGFGLVRDFAARGIRRACGLEVRAPLSGQRAVRAHLLRGLPSADRFGLEVAMTIDVARAGGRVVEVEVPMDHRHTGRSLSGFAHRARQGRDIARSLWPRVTTPRQRIAAMVVLTVLVCGLAAISGSRQLPVTQPLGATPAKVLVFGIEPFGFDDLDLGIMPNLQRLVGEGSLGAMSVRTVARHPNASEGYLSLGAGARLSTVGLADAVLPQAEPVANGTAGGYVRSLTNVTPQGQLVVIGGPALLKRNDGPEAASPPGTLGDALRAAGMSGAVVGNSDQPDTFSMPGYQSRPAALAVMTSDFGVPRGRIDAAQVLTHDEGAPYGVQADVNRVAAATLDELRQSQVVVVDPGDLTRATRFGAAALKGAREAQWQRALVHTDQILGKVLDGLDADTMVLVVSVSARGGQFRPTPVVAWGPGVPHGTITSPSTQRHGVMAITDVAPTILAALGIDLPVDLPGHAVRYEAGRIDPGALRSLDADTVVKERTYGGTSSNFIWFFTILYALALFVISARPRFLAASAYLRLAILALAAFPVATFLVRLVPGLTTSFTAAQPLVETALAVVIGLLASRSRRHALSSLAWVLGLTVAVILVDTWTGTRMHMSSWLGYSLHSPGRFYGVPNTTFAVLGACTLLLGGIVVDRSPRRSEALWKVSCLFVVVLVSAGLPMLGADVGTLITLFPIFGVLVLVLSGRKVRLRTLVVAGLAMVAMVGLAAGLDMARPAQDQTHLGRFAEKVIHDGPSALTDSFTRKQSANLRILGGSIWSHLIPAAGIFLFIPLVWERRAREILPPRSAIRAAFVAVLAAALLGFASNDSGPIVVALFLAFLPPLITLIVLGSREGAPELLAATPAATAALAVDEA